MRHESRRAFLKRYPKPDNGRILVKCTCSAWDHEEPGWKYHYAWSYPLSDGLLMRYEKKVWRQPK